MNPAVMKRFVPFLFFAILCGAALPGVWGTRVGVPAPTDADLHALEVSMAAGAVLHQPHQVAELPGTASFCRECHHQLPHEGTGVEPAMRNEHARRMDCLLCHWSPAAGSRPTAVWRAREKGAEFLVLLPPERSDRDALVKIRAAVTVGRKCFERGPGCTGCHRSGAIDALLRPGQSAAGLEQLEDYFLLSPGKKWYFPHFN